MCLILKIDDQLQKQQKKKLLFNTENCMSLKYYIVLQTDCIEAKKIQVKSKQKRWC